MINFTVFDKIGVFISIIMIIMLFAIALKASGLILQDFEYLGFFQVWLLFGFYYLVNMFVRAAYLVYKKDKEDKKETGNSFTVSDDGNERQHFISESVE